MKRKRRPFLPPVLLICIVIVLLLLSGVSLFKLSSSLAAYQQSRDRLASALAEQERSEQLLNGTREAILKQAHTAGGGVELDTEAARRIVLRGETPPASDDAIFSGDDSTFGVLPQD